MNTVLTRTNATSGIGLGLALRLREAGNAVKGGGRYTDLLDIPSFSEACEYVLADS